MIKVLSRLTHTHTHHLPQKVTFLTLLIARFMRERDTGCVCACGCACVLACVYVCLVLYGCMCLLGGFMWCVGACMCVGWGIPITKIIKLIIKKFYCATASGTCLSTNGISNESLQQYRMITASFCHVSSLL